MTTMTPRAPSPLGVAVRNHTTGTVSYTTEGLRPDCPPHILEKTGTNREPEFIIRCLRCDLPTPSGRLASTALEWFAKNHVCRNPPVLHVCPRDIGNRRHYLEDETCRCADLDRLHVEWYEQAMVVEVLAQQYHQEEYKLNKIATLMQAIG